MKPTVPPAPQEVAVVAAMDLDKLTRTQILVVKLSMKERIGLAAKRWLVWCSVALACVFVPVFHFVLVPVALITSVLAAYRQLGLRHRLISGSVLCPQCQKAFALPRAPFNWPHRETCPQCAASLLLFDKDSP